MKIHVKNIKRIEKIQIKQTKFVLHKSEFPETVLTSQLSFLVPRSSFLISHFSFLISHFSFLILTCELCNNFKKLCNIIFEKDHYLCGDVKILSHYKIKHNENKITSYINCSFPVFNA